MDAKIKTEVRHPIKQYALGLERRNVTEMEWLLYVKEQLLIAAINIEVLITKENEK